MGVTSFPVSVRLPSSWIELWAGECFLASSLLVREPGHPVLGHRWAVFFDQSIEPLTRLEPVLFHPSVSFVRLSQVLFLVRFRRCPSPETLRINPFPEGITLVLDGSSYVAGQDIVWAEPGSLATPVATLLPVRIASLPELFRRNASLSSDLFQLEDWLNWCCRCDPGTTTVTRFRATEDFVWIWSRLTIQNEAHAD